jgi:hypothetical protein
MQQLYESARALGPCAGPAKVSRLAARGAVPADADAVRCPPVPGAFQVTWTGPVPAGETGAEVNGIA